MTKRDKLDIVFMGTPDFSDTILTSLLESRHNVQLVITQPDRPKGRGKQLTPPPVKDTANAYEIPVSQPEYINDDSVIKHIAKIKPDLIVTAAYGQKVPSDILNIPKQGAINVHASLLPKYRGAAPIHYAVMNGEVITGVTIIYMTTKMDAGKILRQEKVHIKNNETTGEVYHKILNIAPEVLLTTMEEILNGTVTPWIQDEDKVTFAPKLTKQDEKIDFTRQSADQIYNMIRGLNPWPGAYCHYHNIRVKLWQSEVVNMDNEEGEPPGDIVQLDQDGPIVKCDSGFLKIKKLQPAGKKPITGEQFIKGYQVDRGESFK